jgi:hypothetical protein
LQSRTVQHVKKGQEKRVKLKMCHSQADLYRDFHIYPNYDEDDIATLVDSDDEAALYVRCNFKMISIHKEVVKVFGTTKGLEIYDLEKRKWLPLLDLKDWTQYRGSAEPMLLRIPEFYDDTPVDEAYPSLPMSREPSSNMVSGPSDDEEDINDILKSTKPLILADTIHVLVQTLKAAGYERSSADTLMTMRNDHGEIATRDWILQQGERHPHVAAVLLGHIGALNHMVECLHYNCVWIDRDEKQGVNAAGGSQGV